MMIFFDILFAFGELIYIWNQLSPPYYYLF